MSNSLMFLVISLFAFWAVISRPDRWAGAADYLEAVAEVFEAFTQRRQAQAKHLARFRYLNLLGLASASFSLALLYMAIATAPESSEYLEVTLSIFKVWFTLTVISLAVGLALGPALKRH